MSDKRSISYLVPLFAYVLIIKFAVLGSLIKTVGQLASVGIVLGLLTIIPLWSVIRASFAELKWRSLLYLISLIIAQLLTFALISLLVTHIGHVQMPMHSSNQTHMNGMGTYAAKNNLVAGAYFVFVALIGPMTENILFLYLIQGIILTHCTRKFPQKLGLVLRVVVTTLLFTLWHMTRLSDLSSPMFYEYLSLIWLSIIYEYSHSLAKTWLAHAGLNTVSAIMMLGI